MAQGEPVRGATRHALFVVAAALAVAAVLVASSRNNDSSGSPRDTSAAQVADSTAAVTTTSTAVPKSSQPTTTSSTSTTSTSTTTTVFVPAPCHVVAVGDSVGTGVINHDFDAALAGVQCELVWKGGRPGITVAEGAAALGQAKGQPAEVAVVMLGFHNAYSMSRSGDFPGLIDTVMEAAGDRLVVWAMLAPPNDCSSAYKAATVKMNADLQTATGRWPNLALADYPTFLAAHPDYTENRCPHLIGAGYTAVGEWLASQVRLALEARRPPA